MNIAIREIEARLPHYAKGPIVKGFGRGSSELGFPTANFSDDVIEKLPQELVGGIYFGFGKVDDGPVHRGVQSGLFESVLFFICFCFSRLKSVLFFIGFSFFIFSLICFLIN